MPLFNRNQEGDANVSDDDQNRRSDDRASSEPKYTEGTQQTDTPDQDDVARDAIVIPEYERKLSDARDRADLADIEALQGEYTEARLAKLQRDQEYADQKRQEGGDR